MRLPPDDVLSDWRVVSETLDMLEALVARLEVGEPVAERVRWVQRRLASRIDALQAEMIARRRPRQRRVA